MIISDQLDYAALYAVLENAGAVLGLRVNPTVMTVRECRSKRRALDSFANRVSASPRLFVLGTDEELG
jgi:hypothetical protein